MTRPGHRRRATVALATALGLVAVVALGGCSGDGGATNAEPTRAEAPSTAPKTTDDTSDTTAASSAPTTSARREPGLGAAAFADADAAMADRVGAAGIGGLLLIVRDGEVLFERSYGGVGRDTPLSVASTAKWVTSATVLTVVDEGLLTLDDPISRWMPDLEGPVRDATVRQLLSHTSGVKQQNCIFDPSDVLADCVDRLLAAPLEFEPGTAFSYGNASYHVAARLAEIVTGTEFQALFAERIAEPLGMTGTRWGYGETRNPTPASSMITTVHDMAPFLQMNLDGGTFEGRRILSEASVAEFRRNQVAGYDTSGDYAVGITRIPTYGFGTWRDIPDGDDDITVMSGNGAGGYYPWIDPDNGVYGILAVEDRRGAEVAVPASKVVVDLAIEATPNA